MAYTKTTWADGENKYNITDQYGNILSSLGNVKLTNIGAVGTPISATNLNKIEQGIFDLDGNKISTSQIGVASGVCDLDPGTLIPTARLPVIPTAKLTNAFSSLDTLSQQWELLASAYPAGNTTSSVMFASLPVGYDAFRIVGRLCSAFAGSNDTADYLWVKVNGIATGYQSKTQHGLAYAVTSGSDALRWWFDRFLLCHTSSQLQKGLIDIVIDAIPNSSNYIFARGSSRGFNTYGSGFDDMTGALYLASVVSQIEVGCNNYFDTGCTLKLYGAKKFAA